MSVTIEGPILSPLDSGRTLVANTARWQSLRGASGPTAVDTAKLGIFLESVPEPEDEDWSKVLPFAVMMNTIPAGFHAEKDSVDAYEHDGVFDMEFWFGNQFESKRDNRLQMLADIGVIVEQMETISGDDAFLNLRDIVVVEGPVDANKEDELIWGPHQIIALRVQWGT